MALRDKQQRFAEEYVVDLNATAAYKRAGYKCEGHAAEVNANRMLSNAEVQAAIQSLQAERSKRTEITADQVLQHWWEVARADPNELIEMRRTCCRCCHGIDHLYQFTRGELASAMRSWSAEVEKQKAERKVLPPFDPLGGDGYDARKPPHAECPECFGEGVAVPFPKDTRDLSEGARRLYAGVKVTKDGLEIKMHDQAVALANVAKHLGMFADRVEVTGRDGGPIPIAHSGSVSHLHGGLTVDDLRFAEQLANDAASSGISADGDAQSMDHGEEGRSDPPSATEEIPPPE